MSASPFLQSIAKGYSSRFNKPGLPLSYEYCFVFPNKRAGTFFLKYLRDQNSGGLISPEITTITDFTGRLSGRVVGNRLDLIFLLYNCYCDILSPGVSPEDRSKVLSFDSFRKWGDTVLRDFNDVDMQNVDPEKIFKNISDLKKIMSNFLTDEQKRVIEEYFGYKVPDTSEDGFWIDFDKETETIADPTEETHEDSVIAGLKDQTNISKPTLRSKFIHLWKVLLPLYVRFHKAMNERGIATSGAAYRLAVENLISATEDTCDSEKINELLPWKKIVMVGFNALSLSERLLFRTLSRLTSPSGDERLVDFIWDATGPVLSDRNNPAGRFVNINRRDFPEPKWIKEYMEESKAIRLPGKMEIAASPSKVMQVKIASNIISDLKDEIGNEPFDNARVALVVPDESLLLPLLYSIPEGLENVNLTMGYPLKLTAVTSFLVLLRRLQLSRRDSSEYKGFAYENLSDLLSHPYSHAIFSTKKIRKFRKEYERRHITVVREKDLQQLGPHASVVLHPLSENMSSSEVIRYLEDVLRIIAGSLTSAENKDDSGNLIKEKIDMTHISAWFDALRRFEDSVDEYGVRLSVSATLGEAYRLLQGEVVALEGEPLQGLQIMGMLETRALDFDHIVIVGMNDRTIPGRMKQRSFIPNVIRRGFGMPVNTYQEELFGYYFFRLISRAKTATFIYDNRVSGGNGGESRYLLQLRYLYARDEINVCEYKFSLSGNKTIIKSINKDLLVRNRLNRYCNPEFVIRYERPYRKNLSASLMKTYTDCPVKFYYKAILDFKDDPEASLSVSPITIGNIIHGVIEELYIPDKNMREKWLEEPIKITAEKITHLLSPDGQERILKLIQDKILKEHFKIDDSKDNDYAASAEIDIIGHNLRLYINDILNYDLKKVPFNLYGTEIREHLEYEIPGGKKINMEYALDRVDDINCESEEERRIVDYKTGGSHITVSSLEGLMQPDYRKNNLLQLLVYSLLINYKRGLEGKSPIDFKPVIYPVGRLMKKYGKAGEKEDMLPKIGETYLESTKDILPDFKIIFDSMLTEIFISEDPFEAEITQKRCELCPFIDACKTN